MTNLPIRGLGAVGVITDIDPYSLPINAYTRAKNVRFNEGKVTRAPVYRDISGNLTINPKFIYGVSALAGFDVVLVVGDNFDIYEMSNGILAQKYNSSLTISPVTPVTATILADVQYINRSNAVPVQRVPSASNFSVLPNWPSNTTTTAIRSYGDFLIALGTIENGVEYPNRVRFSDPVLANQVPTTWDETDLTNSAGFNDLVQMKTPIVDGATLGSNFLVYSQDQVWMMEFVGGAFIFNFRKIFDDAGVINQNCIQEVEGKHYVFDRDDIYMTDGNTRQSICDGRVREYIFSGLDNSRTDKCFILHNSLLEELYFCYHSGDDMAELTDADKCNRAAVYNYKEDNWSFYDMPNVVSGTEANVNSVSTYAESTTTYDDVGGSYHSQESPYQRHPLLLGSSGVGIADSKVYGIDLLEKGSLSQSIDTNVSNPFFLERVGLDLDDQGIPLTGYKVISRITPQISTDSSNGTFEFTFGAADLPHAAPNYGSMVGFDALSQYKVDARMSGRYLSYKVSTSADKDFNFTGMDVEVAVTGRR